MKATSLKWLKDYNLLIFDRLDSTNLEARRLAETGINGEFVIWAKSQSSGRGRSNKHWVSEEGNLYISLLLRPMCRLNCLTQFSFITSLALYDALYSILKEENINVDISLKWPNDVLISGKKSSGILLESVTLANNPHADYLIVGVGVNVNNPPQITDYEVTSLIDHINAAQETGVVLDRFMTAFDRYYRRWEKEGFLKLRRLWLSKAYNINKVVTVKIGKNRVSGIFKDIDLNGSMRIRLASGQIYTISAGEVFFAEENIAS